MEIGKIPPNDIEAEQAISGSMLTEKDAVASAIEVLKADDFYNANSKATGLRCGNTRMESTIAL